MNNIYCPHCGEEWNGYECNNCGFADDYTIDEQYKTPQGLIVNCTQEEALDREYISVCPKCGDIIIQWWEKQDHGMCIHCWHDRNIDNLNK